jgi:YVTN family beta-propeller protein
MGWQSNMKSVSTVRAFLAGAVVMLAVQGFRAGGAAGQGSMSATGPVAPLAGMPPVLDPHDIYAADRPGNLSPTLKNFPARIYVPNSGSDTVDVIDPSTYKIIDHFAVGKQPQHVTPS